MNAIDIESSPSSTRACSVLKIPVMATSWRGCAATAPSAEDEVAEELELLRIRPATMSVVTGLSRQASSRSLMRDGGPTIEISSAKSSGTDMIASSRLPAKKSSWILSASSSKPIRCINLVW